MSVKTRFAPSPTGYLHIGSLRTALYNYLFAKKSGGIFALRIEDTDRQRYVEGAVEKLIATLNTVGLNFDEGPVVQSERLSLYQKHAKQLVDQGDAYYCFCTKERLEELRHQQELAKMPTKYDRRCLSLSSEEIQKRTAAGEAHVVRLKIPEGNTAFDDVIRGRITISNNEVDDQVLLKSDGFPTYHLAVVVDDHDMSVTHVIRGDEWLSSVPKHVVLYRAFGWELPIYAHLPLILNPDRSKLSKRQGDVAVEDYLMKGYLPETLVNFVALIGYNPKADQEIYTIDELIASFELEKINRSGGVFNKEKLDWMNAEYIRKMSNDDLAISVKPFLESTGKGIDSETLKRICTVEKERLVTLADIVEKIDGYARMPAMDANLLVWKKSDATDAKRQIEAVEQVLSGLDESAFGQIGLLEAAVKKYIDDNGLQNGNVLWPMRVALSGRTASPGPFELAWVLGQQETLKRLRAASDSLA
jgi:glutamyl-tRNA synthetase